MLNFRKNDSYKNALNDLKKFYYDFQFRPTQEFHTSPIILIQPKNILDMFKIDLVNHRKARLALQVHLHGFTPSEIDGMWYMDFEYKLIDLSEFLKEKNEAEKASYEKEKGNQPKMPNMSQNKMPKMPNMKFPKY